MNTPKHKDLLGFERLRCEIDILGMTKTHLTETGDEEIASTGHRMILSGHTSSKSNGVGLLLNKKAKK
jgi:hypothetical protein